jgi:hypothetical protein
MCLIKGLEILGDVEASAYRIGLRAPSDRELREGLIYSELVECVTCHRNELFS